MTDQSQSELTWMTRLDFVTTNDITREELRGQLVAACNTCERYGFKLTDAKVDPIALPLEDPITESTSKTQTDSINNALQSLHQAGEGGNLLVYSSDHDGTPKVFYEIAPRLVAKIKEHACSTVQEEFVDSLEKIINLLDEQ